MLIVLELDTAAEGGWTGCRQTKLGKWLAQTMIVPSVKEKLPTSAAQV